MEPPILKIAGCSEVQHLQQAVCYSVNTISVLTTTFFSADSKEGCSSFLPPPPTQAWMTLLWWHTSGSTKLGMRAEGRKNGRRRGREAAKPLSAAQEHCPAVLVWEFLATQGETSGEGTGIDGWVDGNRHWACTQRMEEAVWDFYSLRPYSMLSPAVSQAFRCHSNHEAGSGVFRSLRYKDVFK